MPQITMEQLEAMSLEELWSYNQKLTEQRRLIREVQLAMKKIIDCRSAEAQAKKTLEHMSDAERIALAQAINVNGVATTEGVGTPGD